MYRIFVNDEKKMVLATTDQKFADKQGGVWKDKGGANRDFWMALQTAQKVAEALGYTACAGRVMSEPEA